MSIKCKSCGADNYVKNGHVRGYQRYKCKNCDCNFIKGDKRQKVTAEGKALAVLLYGRGSSSYGFIAKLFKVTRSAVLKWLKEIGGYLPEPEIDKSIKKVQFDEMWHFINEKNKSYGCGGQWMVLESKPLDGLSAIVLLKVSGNSLKGLKI